MAYFSEKVMDELRDSILMIFGADLVLGKLIAENKDPAFLDERDA